MAEVSAYPNISSRPNNALAINSLNPSHPLHPKPKGMPKENQPLLIPSACIPTKQYGLNTSPKQCSHSRSPYSGVAGWLDNFFQISERGSSFSTELRGGTVGFLTLAYIVLLNPQVLAVSGIPYEYAASSTCLASCIATLICGLIGNIPVGCGPGVGLSAYFSYSMMPSIINSSSTSITPYLSGLFMAFLSGAIVFLLTVPGIVTYIVNALPEFLKIATIVGMGLFLAFVGMVDVALVVPATGQGDAILALGDLSDWIIWLSLFNCLLIGTLKYFKITGSLLICIIFTSIVYFAVSEQWPDKFLDLPTFQNPLHVLNLEVASHLPLQTAIESILSFVLILFLDVSGVTFAIAKLCNLSDRKETLIAFQKSAFIGTSIGSMIAAVLGCSPIIVCIETSSGAAAGARTGLSAVVIAFYFLIAMFLGPVIGDVPAAATSPVLVFIGTLMMGEVGHIDWSNMRVAIPAFLCIVMMPFTYSISNGLFFGVVSFFLIWVSTGQWISRFGLCGISETLDAKLGYGLSKKMEDLGKKVDSVTERNRVTFDAVEKEVDAQEVEVGVNVDEQEVEKPLSSGSKSSASRRMSYDVGDRL